MGIESEGNSDESKKATNPNESSPTPEELAYLKSLYQVDSLDEVGEKAVTDVDKVISNADNIDFGLENEELSPSEMALIAELLDPDFDRKNISAAHIKALAKDPDIIDAFVADRGIKPLTDTEHFQNVEDRRLAYESAMRAVGRTDEDIDPQFDNLMARIRAGEEAERQIKKASEG